MLYGRLFATFDVWSVCVWQCRACYSHLDCCYCCCCRCRCCFCCCSSCALRRNGKCCASRVLYRSHAENKFRLDVCSPEVIQQLVCLHRKRRTQTKNASENQCACTDNDPRDICSASRPTTIGIRAWSRVGGHVYYIFRLFFFSHCATGRNFVSLFVGGFALNGEY